MADEGKVPPVSEGGGEKISKSEMKRRKKAAEKAKKMAEKAAAKAARELEKSRKCVDLTSRDNLLAIFLVHNIVTRTRGRKIADVLVTNKVLCDSGVILHYS